jgi:hypothetical protein
MQVPCSTPPESEPAPALSFSPLSWPPIRSPEKREGAGPLFDEQREPAPHSTPLFPGFQRRSAYFFGILRSV